MFDIFSLKYNVVMCCMILIDFIIFGLCGNRLFNSKLEYDYVNCFVNVFWFFFVFL